MLQFHFFSPCWHHCPKLLAFSPWPRPPWLGSAITTIKARIWRIASIDMNWLSKRHHTAAKIGTKSRDTGSISQTAEETLRILGKSRPLAPLRHARVLSRTLSPTAQKIGMEVVGRPMEPCCTLISADGSNSDVVVFSECKGKARRGLSPGELPCPTGFEASSIIHIQSRTSCVWSWSFIIKYIHVR